MNMTSETATVVIPITQIIIRSLVLALGLPTIISLPSKKEFSFWDGLVTYLTFGALLW